MNEDEATSSTFWRVGGRLSEGYLFSPDLQVSHNATRGKFDYIISVEAKQGHHIEHRLGFFGLSNALVSVDHTWNDTSVIDQFSGLERLFKWQF